MTSSMVGKLLVAAIVAGVGMSVSFGWSSNETPSLSFSQADARVGPAADAEFRRRRGTPDHQARGRRDRSRRRSGGGHGLRTRAGQRDLRLPLTAHWNWHEVADRRG